ncbi:hypothetical protein ACFQGT_04805 [Natrialbaceae archaeon GCM10025810]|uniref:hypothetical protein n=1 Tax=Halovalidus salilacus TaxID=3075124 RepID=UPI0036126E98
MSDDRAPTEPDDGTDGDADSTPELESVGGLSTPGGGPRRVVSSRSVDDILDSLEVTPDGETDAADRPTNGTSDPLEDETELGTPSESTDDDVELGATGAELDRTDSDSRASDGTCEVDGRKHQRGSTANAPSKSETIDAAAAAVASIRRDENASPTAGEAPEPSESTDRGGSIRADEPNDGESNPDPDHRLERDEITGADVRAAEAVDGRERTPEIDELDLTLDDLESTEDASQPPRAGTETGPTVRGDALPNDAGPLAGAVGPGGAPGESETAAREDGDTSSATKKSDDGDGSSGLFGRIKRLFSR